MGAVKPKFQCQKCQGVFETGYIDKDQYNEFGELFIPKGTVMVPHAGCYHCGHPYVYWWNYKETKGGQRA